MNKSVSNLAKSNQIASR
jgi:hypothetical protein